MLSGIVQCVSFVAGLFHSVWCLLQSSILSQMGFLLEMTAFPEHLPHFQGWCKKGRKGINEIFSELTGETRAWGFRVLREPAAGRVMTALAETPAAEATYACREYRWKLFLSFVDCAWWCLLCRLVVNARGGKCVQKAMRARLWELRSQIMIEKQNKTMSMRPWEGRGMEEVPQEHGITQTVKRTLLVGWLQFKTTDYMSRNNLARRPQDSQHIKMINVWRDNTNVYYCDWLITRCMHVLNDHNVPHKGLQILWFRNEL